MRGLNVSGRMRNTTVSWQWQEMSTADLVTLARAGQMDAFDPLFRRFQPELLRIAQRRLSGDAAAAQDLVSDVWVQMLTGIGRNESRHGDPEHDFRQRLFGLLRTMCAQYAAARWREIATDEIDPEATVCGTSIEDDGDDVRETRARLLDKLRAGLDQLSDGQREALWLRTRGYDGNEAAERMGVSREQVYMHWHRGEKRLREILSDPIADATPGQLADAARLLEEPFRQVIELSLQGLGPGEIAARTGHGRRYVNQLTRNGRDKLRRLLLEPATSGVGDLEAARQRRDLKRAQLRQVAGELPERQRQVALMRIDGMKDRAIAEVLGSTVSTVASTWVRARDNLSRFNTGLVLTARAA